jgi:hypothetical protein
MAKFCQTPRRKDEPANSDRRDRKYYLVQLPGFVRNHELDKMVHCVEVNGHQPDNDTHKADDCCVGRCFGHIELSPFFTNAREGIW